MREKRIVQYLWLMAMMGLAMAASACSSSFGGGDPPPAKVIVAPQGAYVCPNGSAPPC